MSVVISFFSKLDTSLFESGSKTDNILRIVSSNQDLELMVFPDFMKIPQSSIAPEITLFPEVRKGIEERKKPFIKKVPTIKQNKRRSKNKGSRGKNLIRVRDDIIYFDFCYRCQKTKELKRHRATTKLQNGGCQDSCRLS